MHRRSFNWVALVGIGLAGVVAVSAATALAARSAASPFELVVQGRGRRRDSRSGTFTSSAPFCESGDGRPRTTFLGEYRERYTVSDGSGSLTFRFDARSGTRETGRSSRAPVATRGLRGKGNTSSRP